MKAKLLWLGLGLSVLVAFFSFALLQGPQPAAPSAVAPVPPLANTLRIVPTDPTPVPDTNGVPVPGETPYDDRPEPKAHYLKNYCDGYRLAATNGFMWTSCWFGPEPPPENVQAANAGWIAGQKAGISNRVAVMFSTALEIK
jgi:hypothetical protein